MLRVLSVNWHLLVIRALLSIAFGLFLLVWTHLTIGTLVILFGWYAIWDGTFAFILALRTKGLAGHGSLLFEASVSFLIGVVTIALSPMGAMPLLSLIATWVVLRGIAAITAGIELAQELAGEWPLLLAGALSILTGPLIIWNPQRGALTSALILSLHALIVGLALLTLGLRIRRFADEIRVS